MTNSREYMKEWNHKNKGYKQAWHYNHIATVKVPLTQKEKEHLIKQAKEQKDKAAHRQVMLDTDQGNQGDVL